MMNVKPPPPPPPPTPQQKNQTKQTNSTCFLLTISAQDVFRN